MVRIAISQAQHVPQEWVDAWNSRDLDRVMWHYAEDLETTPPLIAMLANEPAGTPKGKAKVRAYWAKVLERLPDLHFDRIEVLAGVANITIYYQAVLGKRAAEVLFLDESGQVTSALAHYSS